MILSFSVPAMLPYIEAGIRQHAGEDVDAERVKRQTIRRRGPRAEKLLGWDTIAHTQPYDLHLWWKSRTPQRRHLGTIAGGSKVYPITILHSTVEPPDGPPYPIIRIDGPRGWREGDAMLFWSGDYSDPAFRAEARADGFDSAQAFRDYFVPNLGDRFEGILFKW